MIRHLSLCPRLQPDLDRPADGLNDRIAFSPAGVSLIDYVAFTSGIDPTIVIHAVQHLLTHRNGQVSDDLPIVQVETLQNRALSHVRDFSRIFARHSLVALLAISACRSDVRVEVAWAALPFNLALRPSATATGLLSTGLGCCPVTLSIIDLASWLEALGRLGACLSLEYQKALEAGWLSAITSKQEHNSKRQVAISARKRRTRSHDYAWYTSCRRRRLVRIY